MVPDKAMEFRIWWDLEFPSGGGCSQLSTQGQRPDTVMGAVSECLCPGEGSEVLDTPLMWPLVNVGPA